MAKLLATDLHPYVAAKPANSAIKDGESSELEKYVTLCPECESIAVQIHQLHKEKYVDVAAMSMPLAIVNWLITAQYLFMSKEKEIFKAMQAKLEDQSTKDGSGSASTPSSEDPPFKTPQPKQRTKGASPGEAETRPRKRKKEGATEHSWPDNERILTNCLQELELDS